jgi:hypothetical protein
MDWLSFTMGLGAGMGGLIVALWTVGYVFGIFDDDDDK